jgi:hypothetical protein
LRIEAIVVKRCESGDLRGTSMADRTARHKLRCAFKSFATLTWPGRTIASAAPLRGDLSIFCNC